MSDDFVYDVCVIGSGVGGLVAAYKLSSEGKKVLLLERQPKPGGYATTFKRAGFTFESAVHCVDDLGNGGDVKNFLKDNGLLNKLELIPLKEFARIFYPEHDFVADFNCENFVSFLKREFSFEARNIDKLMRAIAKFYAHFDRFRTSNLPDCLDMLFVMFFCPALIKASVLSIEQFMDEYIKDEKLKSIFTHLWHFHGLPPERLSALFYLQAFRGYHYNRSAYIRGGFIKLFEVMVEEIRRYGSEVKFNTCVTQIVTEKRKAKAIRTKDGKEYKVKAVISNANAIDTLTRFIDDEGIKDAYRKRIIGLERSISGFQVYVGLKTPAQNLGMTTWMYIINASYDHKMSFSCAARGDYDSSPFEIVDHARNDPSLVPSGKGSLIIMTLDAYKNWENLDEKSYREKKELCTRKLLARAKKYLPNIYENIEIVETATPHTFERYTLSTEGAIYAFAPTTEQAGINRLKQETRVKGLFLAGAWTRPGHGVHACLLSGQEAAKLVLRFLR